MFVVCEPIVWGMEHVPFNASLLRTMRYAFPEEAIRFCGEESHVEHVREQTGAEFANSIAWQNLVLPPRHSTFFSRFFSDFSTVKFLLNELDGNSSKNILVLTGNPSLLWALKFLVSTTHKDKKIQMILHGDFSGLPLRQSLRRRIDPFYRISSLRTALRVFGHRRIQHIVLEEAVRNAVLKHLPILDDSLFVLDHPIPVESEPVESTSFHMPLHFGFLGRATEHKGFMKYLSVAADISKEFPGKAKFHVVGRITDEYKRSNLPGMEFLSDVPGTDRLSRSEYVHRVQKLHFVCMFFDESYELTASGVLLDCAAFGKPVIATQLTALRNLTERFGDIGYFCKPHEFTQTIASIIEENDSSRYNRQVSNLLEIRDSRTPETLAKKYHQLAMYCVLNGICRHGVMRDEKWTDHELEASPRGHTQTK